MQWKKRNIKSVPFIWVIKRMNGEIAESPCWRGSKRVFRTPDYFKKSTIHVVLPTWLYFPN